MRATTQTTISVTYISLSCSTYVNARTLPPLINVTPERLADEESVILFACLGRLFNQTRILKQMYFAFGAVLEGYDLNSAADVAFKESSPVNRRAICERASA